MTLPILLLGLGMALVVAEVLFPSFGVLSVLATISVIAAVALAFQRSTETGVSFLVVTAVLIPIAILTGLKLFPRSPFGRHYVAAGPSFGNRAAIDERDLALEGAEGTVEAECRPAGIARIAGRRVDVVSRGEVLATGTAIRVAEVRGNRVVVVRASEEPA